MSVFRFVTLIKLPEKFTAMVTESDMIDHGNSFDKLTKW